MRSSLHTSCNTAGYFLAYTLVYSLVKYSCTILLLVVSVAICIALNRHEYSIDYMCAERAIELRRASV